MKMEEDGRTTTMKMKVKKDEEDGRTMKMKVKEGSMFRACKCTVFIFK